MKVNRKFGFGAALGVAVAAVVGMTASASATTLYYDFSNNIGGSPGSESGASFSLAVTNNFDGTASFTFGNSLADSSITGIWFYDGVVMDPSNASITGNLTGNINNWNVNSGSPGDLPGITDYFGQGGGPNFPATLELYSAINGFEDGIRFGDDLTVTVDLSVSFNTMIQMLEAGFGIGSGFNSDDHFVIGIQVQGLEDGGSAQYVVNVIPLPAPVWMGLAGLVGVVAMRRRFSRM